MATVFEFAPTTTVTNGAAVPTNASIYDVVNGSVTYDTTVKFQTLTASARCLNDASAVATLEQTFTAVTTRYVSRVMRRAAFTSGTFTTLTRLRNAAGAGCLEVRVNSTGNLLLRDLVANTNYATSTTATVVGTPFRFEIDVVGASVTLRIYANATSSTVTETLGPFTYSNGSFNTILDGVGTPTGLTTVHVMYAADGDTSNPSVSRFIVADSTAPTVPSGLTATPSATAVGLTWSPSTDANGVASYRLRRGGTDLTGATALTSPGFTDTGVTAGSTYSYTVSAIDAAGNRSAESAAAVAIVPSLNTGLRQYAIVAGVKKLVTTRSA